MKGQHRGIVMSKNGMVCSGHYQASWVGADVLNKGGNAMDAAVAVALATGVVQPDMCGLGGDAFLLFYNGETGKVTTVNGSGATPMKLSKDYLTSKNINKLPQKGVLSASVPGAVDVYFKALENFGTMTFKALSQYAIKYAEEGIPVSQKLYKHLVDEVDKLNYYDSSAKIFLKDGKPYQIGELLVNQDYAKTLRILSEKGPDAFYHGELAKKIEDYSMKHEGLLKITDFKAHTTYIGNPISTSYRGYKVYQNPPVSQGVVLLEELNILEGYDLNGMGGDSAEALHLMVEAKKIAFADRIKYFGDPRMIKNPTDGALSKEYAAVARESIDSNKANFGGLEESPFDYQGNTTSFVVVDKWGNAVSFIHSLCSTFGGGEVIGGTGMFLNNRAGYGFNLIDGHPNCLAPGKKTMHTLNTWLITKDNNVKWLGNTPGGDSQPQWNMQVIVNLIDFGMNVQQAVEAPRWIDFQDTTPEGMYKKTKLKIECRIPKGIKESLIKKGHDVILIDPLGASGGFQVIEVTKDGVMLGGSDPRGDGAAIGI